MKRNTADLVQLAHAVDAAAVELRERLDVWSAALNAAREGGQRGPSAPMFQLGVDRAFATAMKGSVLRSRLGTPSAAVTFASMTATWKRMMETHAGGQR